MRVQLAARTPSGELIVRLEKSDATETMNLLYWGSPDAGLTPLSQGSVYEEMRKGEMVHLSIKFQTGRGGRGEKGTFFYGYDPLFGLHANEIKCKSGTIRLTPLAKDEIRVLEGRIRLGAIALHPFPEVYSRPVVYKNPDTGFYIYFDQPMFKATPETQPRVFIGTKGEMKLAQITSQLRYWMGTNVTINKTILFFSPRESEKGPSTLTRGGTKVSLTPVTADDEIRALAIEGVGIVMGGLGGKLNTPCD